MKTALTTRFLLAAALLLPVLSPAATQGPDGGGYTATNATVYSFVDISGGGGGSSILAGTDDGAAALTIPFNFSFYGTTYTQVCASVNGAVYFVTSATTCGTINDLNNLDLSGGAPAPDLPALFPFWSDLSFADPAAGSIFYQTIGTPGNRRFIIQWSQALTSPGNFVTFEVILAEGTNSISFQYQSVSPSDGAAKGAQATVGIHNTNALSAVLPLLPQQLQWSFNAGVLSDASALIFQTSAAPGAPTLTSPANAATGVASPVTLTWNVATGATAYDVYFGGGTPPPLLASAITDLSYSPGQTLLPGGTYYWKVVAKNSSGSTPSAIFAFAAASVTPPGGGGGGGGIGGIPGPVAQTISFPAIPNHVTGDAPITLNATSSSGLAVVYSVVSGPATLSDNVLTLTGGLGTVIVQAGQPGNAAFLAATPVTQQFTVSQGSSVIASILNAASYANAPLTGGGYSVIFGGGFTLLTQQAGPPPLPTSMAGVSITVTDSAGHSAPALLYYVSPTQINFVMPDGLAAGSATVTVTNSLNLTGTFKANIGSVAPAFFTGDASGTGPGAVVVLTVNPDNTVTNTFPTTCAGSPVVCTANPIVLGPPAQAVYLSLYGTGLRHAGPSTPVAPIAVTVGGVSQKIAYLGPQATYPGLDQVNVLLDPSLKGKGLVDVILSIGGVSSNPIKVNIQ